MSFESGRQERYGARKARTADTKQDIRGHYERDRDRILFSSAFRRLSGITQVVQPDGRYATHNRLTHSLQVAQIARSIGKRFEREYGSWTLLQYGGLSPEVLEAASLAHDIGHPPFGHVAEELLQNKLNSLPDSFEGNAQSFRAITYLSSRFDEVDGLHLTRATLSAVCKYPWMRADSDKKRKKWNAYHTEKEIFEWSRGHLPSYLINRKTLEAEIMDWSDDIAYAVHDLEDFYRAGMIPLDRLSGQTEGYTTELQAYVAWFYHGKSGDDFRSEWTFPEVMDRASELFNSFESGFYRGTRADRIALRKLTSSLINHFIGHTELYTDLREGLEKGPLRISPTLKLNAALLKELTVHYVINSPALAAQRIGQSAVMSNIIDKLIDTLEEDKNSSDSKKSIRNSIITPFYQEVYEDLRTSYEDQSYRVIPDFVCSLTEAQALTLGRLISGSDLSNALRDITE